MTAYLCAINRNIQKTKSAVEQGIEICLKHDNLYDERGLAHHEEIWTKRGGNIRDNGDTSVNDVWLTHAALEKHGTHRLCDRANTSMTLYTLLLPE